MSELMQIPAAKVGLVPYLLKGYERHGLLFYMAYGCDACGAQCGICHTITWFNTRKHALTYEKKPSYIANSGPRYTVYYRAKLRRHMKLLPPCPACGKKAYDLFVSNTTRLRFEDGTPYPKEEKNQEIIEFSPKSVIIWWYEESTPVIYL